jgi:hypothetical protein
VWRPPTVSLYWGARRHTSCTQIASVRVLPSELLVTAPRSPTSQFAVE